MSKFTLEPEKPSSGGFELLPDGSKHPAKVTKAEVKTITPNDKTKEPWDQVEFQFELQGPEYSFVSDTTGQTLQRRIYGKTSTIFNDSPNCKLRAWVTEIFAADSLPEGFSFELDDLIGNYCTVIVDVNEWSDTKVPQSSWPTDPKSGQKVAPKRSNNRVFDVLRADDSAGNTEDSGSFSMSDLEDEPF